MVKQYLLASDFDQTLSFNDSGFLLSELLGASSFGEKVSGLSRIHLVHQGAELSYLILHDPDFRRVRREHLIETGKKVRLKHDVQLLGGESDGFVASHKRYAVAPAAGSHEKVSGSPTPAPSGFPGAQAAAARN